MSKRKADFGGDIVGTSPTHSRAEGARFEDRGERLKMTHERSFDFLCLMPHASRLGPRVYSAVTKDERNPDGIGTDARFAAAC